MSKSNEIKYDLLKTELLLTQQQMDKYDGLSATTKTWVVTLWVATAGWAIQTHTAAIALTGAVTVLLFWFFDGYNKKFRQNYKNRRNEIEEILEAYSKTEVFPEEVSSPHLPTHESGNILRYAVLPHIGFPYLVLFILSMAVYFKIS